MPSGFSQQQTLNASPAGGNITPTPRKTSLLRVPNLSTSPAHLQLQQKQHRLQVRPSPLSAAENANALEVWDNYVKNSYLTQLTELEQLVTLLQVPMQPISRRLCEEEFKASKGRFSSRDFVVLLERLKTLHAKWLHKLRGKDLDDDLLEAFVAVGGQADSHGEVDLAKMRAVVGEFNLNVDLDKIVAEMDNDGNANIDFGEFASLIRDEKKRKSGAGGKDASQRRKHTTGDDDDDEEEDAFSLDGFEGNVVGSPTTHHNSGSGSGGGVAPITLSSMHYVDEDVDQALIFPPTVGLTGRRDGGDLSTRRATQGQLSFRKKSNFHGGEMLTPLAAGAGAAGGVEGNSAKQGLVSPSAHGGGTVASQPRDGPMGKKHLKLAPLDKEQILRTQLAPSVSATNQPTGSSSHASTSGGTAFYKGGGGLRNMTPAPTTNAHYDDDQPARSASVLSGAVAKGQNRSPSPMRGVLRPGAQKKHKFAN